MRCKIGRSVAPTRRLQQLKTGNPNAKKLGLVCTIKTDDMVSLENSMKLTYEHKKIDGEWYELSWDDITDIRGMPGAG